MSKREQGFTLIEQMIVVAIIAIIASIAIPNLLSARLNANEYGGDRDAEEHLVGAVAVPGVGCHPRQRQRRRGTRLLRRAVGPRRGPQRHADDQPAGPVDGVRQRRRGARVPLGLRVPDVPAGHGRAGHRGRRDRWHTDNGQGVDAGQSETLWCCYAWPQVFGNSGKRTFFVNQSGDVLSTNGAAVAYSESTANRPIFSAAFLGTGTIAMSAGVAANTLASDTNRWTVVN